MRASLLVLLTLAAACTGGDEPESCGEEPVTTAVSIEHIGEAYRFADAGRVEAPDDLGFEGAIYRGAVATWQFRAPPGAHLQLASGLYHANDWMLAGPAEGIALWNQGGEPLTGDRTAQLMIWDAGTEADQTMAHGVEQLGRQSAPGQGNPDPDATLRSTTLPSSFEVTDIVRFELALEGEVWTATLSNIGPADALPADEVQGVDFVFAPGVYVVHAANDPLFAAGDTASAAWESLAEDGDPAALAAELDAAVGVIVPLASPFWALSTSEYELYQDGQAASPELQSLAEDGNAGILAQQYEDLSDRPEVIDAGQLQQPDEQEGYEPRPALPGETYLIDLSFVPRPNTLLHAAWMYAQSNDVFFGLADTGVPIVDADCTLLTGEVTPMLWDAGTEVNQEPGFGADQAPRQPSANTGADEGGVVHLVDDGFDYGDPAQVVRITVQ